MIIFVEGRARELGSLFKLVLCTTTTWLDNTTSASQKLRMSGLRNSFSMPCKTNAAIANANARGFRTPVVSDLAAPSKVTNVAFDDSSSMSQSNFVSHSSDAQTRRAYARSAVHSSRRNFSLFQGGATKYSRDVWQAADTH